MELYDEEIEQKKSKTPMIIGISMGILLVLTLAIVVGIVLLKNSITFVQIDGVQNNEISEIFFIETTEEGKELYIPIIRMAKYLKYEGYIGDYKDKSEDNTKCHVTSGEETAMFSKDSNILVKIINGVENEYINLEKPVFEKDGELYTTIEGIQAAFNVLFSYDKKFKDIKIYTMDFLVQNYVTNLNIENYSDEFVDKKAILESMLIVEENGQYGVLDIVQRKYILEVKYEKIQYLPLTNEFLVKINGKYGVMSKDGTIIIKAIYEQIEMIDYRNGLYLVKQNNMYGIIDIYGKAVIEPEYRQIGINMSKYSQNGIENGYILLDKIIPAKNEKNLWALFDINGEQITEFKYTDMGCESLPVSNSYPVLVIPSYKIIVVKNDKNYNLITIEGEELTAGNILGSVYIKLNATTGQNEFYMTSNNNEKVMDVEEWLANIGR